MTAWLRRAGRGRSHDGGVVVWSVAEGRRGRRWRWTVSRGGWLERSALAEVDDRGLFGRLELVTAAGQLTFHPDGDSRFAHGNVVTPAGVRHLSVPWSAEWGIALEGDPFGSALLGGAGATLVIDAALSIRPSEARTELRPVDDRGIPILDDAVDWALEE